MRQDAAAFGVGGSHSTTAVASWPFTFRALTLAWAGKCLLLPPSNFSRFEGGYAPFVSMGVTEHELGVISLLFGILGVVGAWSAGWPGWTLRAIASMFGAVFWTSIGIFFWRADSDVLSIGTMGLAAALFWRHLFSGDRP